MTIVYSPRAFADLAAAKSGVPQVSDMPSAKIESRWLGLPLPCAANPAGIQAALAELIAAYTSPGRHYHGLDHVAALLELSAAYEDYLENREIVDLAIFFHDAVYDVTRSGNEEASARLARDRLTTLGVAFETIAEVARLIEATKHLASATHISDGDLAWFLDFDLSVLGSDRETYARYADAIRREYAIYPDAAYRQGRRTVLESFLVRPSIFATDYLRDRWESAARNNLAWELGRLG